MTFSIAARCPQTGMLGVAVASSSIAVASRCCYLQAGVGAVMSQNVTNPLLGPLALQAMANGLRGDALLQQLAQADPHLQWRQLLALPASGEAVTFSGEHALGVYATASGPHCVAGGNILHSASVPQQMVAAFAASSGHLADRLLAAMQAAVAAGGEAGPIHAAGLKLVASQAWPVIDLRIDWSEQEPVAELAQLWQRYRPQMQDYITRAENPQQAPGFAVPGVAAPR
ncbi:DUF1028 domain-containing protein [Aquitalea sp. FJL05]|uniref:DUF1028 domain-containing protein n=1 Tax=Aquitalea sp. FJL05 TaxID=2153366 RepID=UPI000F59A8BD|nr:DUF1028 domain-containing protein [Aquitalea sp. FJL05]RQO77636.1 DUF1028 domain-containing protein [Aquitalea sp. FJL05]